MRPEQLAMLAYSSAVLSTVLSLAALVVIFFIVRHISTYTAPKLKAVTIALQRMRDSTMDTEVSVHVLAMFCRLSKLTADDMFHCYPEASSAARRRYVQAILPRSAFVERFLAHSKFVTHGYSWEDPKAE